MCVCVYMCVRVNVTWRGIRVTARRSPRDERGFVR